MKIKLLLAIAALAFILQAEETTPTPQTQRADLEMRGQRGNRRPVRIPSWKSLPFKAPKGTLDKNIKCYMEDPDKSDWKQPEFKYDQSVAVNPKHSKVIVVIYNPILKSQGNKTLIEYLKACNPREYSQYLCDAIKECSDGYINYEIVDTIELNAFSEKIDGFKYTEETFLAARKDNSWHQPDRSDYRKIFEENNLIERCKKENIREIWLWGGGGFGYDELAMYFPNRYARFAPTLNPWFYRPYEIPEEIGHSVWVMGFNYEVGKDNMIHSYGHRTESILALVFGHGKWDRELGGQDPWNTFSMVNLDSSNFPSQVGNVHVPPNGRSGYDYGNSTNILTLVDSWGAYPNLTEAIPRMISKNEWQNSQLGYQKWWLKQMPKKPGYTKWGYNNWWVYVANTDEDLPDYYPTGPEEFKVEPKFFPAKK